MAKEVGKGWVWEAAQWWGFRAGKRMDGSPMVPDKIAEKRKIDFFHLVFRFHPAHLLLLTHLAPPILT